MRPSGVPAVAQSWKLEPMKPAVWVPSVSTMPGLTELTRMPFGPEFARKHTGDGVDRALGGGVDRRARRREARDARADIDDAAALSKVLGGFLADQQQAQHIDVECLVKMLFGDLFERLHLVDAGIVDQDVETAKGLDRRVDDGAGVGRLDTSPLTATALPPAALIASTTLSAPSLLERN